MTSDANLEAFLTDRPPRHVPRELRKQAVKRLAGFWLVGAVLGFCFLAFGSLFVWGFVPRNLGEIAAFSFGEPAQTQGTVIGREKTNASINERPVYRYLFEYETAQGTFKATSYTTHASYHPGTTVPVLHLPARPGSAKIAGSQLSPFGMVGLFAAIFPLIGLGILYASVKSRLRVDDLLRNGALTEGKILDFDDRSDDDGHAASIRIEFPDAKGTPRAYPTTLSYAQSIELARNRFERETPVAILYDPSKPKRFLFLETVLVNS